MWMWSSSSSRCRRWRPRASSASCRRARRGSRTARNFVARFSPAAAWRSGGRSAPWPWRLWRPPRARATRRRRPARAPCIATVPACASPAGTRKCARCSAACTARGRTRIPTRSHRTSRAGSGPVPPPAQPPTRPRAMSRSPRSSRRRPRRRPVLLAPRALPPRRCIARIGRWRGRRSPRRRRLHPLPRRGRRSDSGASPRRPSVGAQTPPRTSRPARKLL